MIKIKKGIPLIDQHDKDFLYAGKFGGNYVPETLKKPIEDLTKLFQKLRKDKKFIKERDYYFDNYVGAPTRFIKLQNLTRHLGGAEIWAKVVSDANGGASNNDTTIHSQINTPLLRYILFQKKSYFAVLEEVDCFWTQNCRIKQM